MLKRLDQLAFASETFGVIERERCAPPDLLEEFRFAAIIRTGIRTADQGAKNRVAHKSGVIIHERGAVDSKSGPAFSFPRVPTSEASLQKIERRLRKKATISFAAPARKGAVEPATATS